MEYKLEQIDNPDYLHLKYSGIWDSNQCQQHWESIPAMLAQLDTDRVLMDDRDLEIDTDTSIDYASATQMVNTLALTCKRIAVIDNPNNRELNEFFETVCVNRGLNIRYFIDEAEAISWLKA